MADYYGSQTTARSVYDPPSAYDGFRDGSAGYGIAMGQARNALADALSRDYSGQKTEAEKNAGGLMGLGASYDAMGNYTGMPGPAIFNDGAPQKDAPVGPYDFTGIQTANMGPAMGGVGMYGSPSFVAYDQPATQAAFGPMQAQQVAQAAANVPMPPERPYDLPSIITAALTAPVPQAMAYSGGATDGPQFDSAGNVVGGLGPGSYGYTVDPSGYGYIDNSSGAYGDGIPGSNDDGLGGLY